MDQIRPVESRVTRRCDTCGQIDDHPHHTFINEEGVTISQHMDCCNCDICLTTLEATRGAQGQALADAIVNGQAEQAVSSFLEESK